MINKKAIVLLSGGLDSTTVLAIASKQGYECHALSFNYKQRHGIELEYAKIQADIWGVKSHRIIPVDMGYISEHNHNSSLVNKNVDVPEKRGLDEMTDGIPSTYVPARNTIFLGYAAALSEVVNAEKIFIGVNVLDYSGYPDCRPEFIGAYQNVLEFATEQGISNNRPEIEAPLMKLNKAEIISVGLELGVNYDLTNSCYNPIKAEKESPLISIPCGVCDSCILREKGFKEAKEINKEQI